MKGKFYAPDLTDERINYAIKYLDKMGYIKVESPQNADFVVLGVNPDKKFLNYDKPIFAGNIRTDNTYDYTKNENFALKNAYLTAEGAIASACELSDKSLINACVLITGYGRIGKVLHRILSMYTNDITVCARNKNSRTLAEYNGAKTVDFNNLVENNSYSFIFNTVAHPVFNDRELSAINEDTLMLDLASFPGGVDKHIANLKKINFVVARGLPAKYSPDTAGKIVAQTINEMLEEVVI